MGFKKKVYFHEETHLPEEGWLQGCFECNEITSSVMEYKIVTRGRMVYEFIFYLCRRCKKQLAADEEANRTFTSRCEIIVNDYLGPCRSESPGPPAGSV